MSEGHKGVNTGLRNSMGKGHMSRKSIWREGHEEGASRWRCSNDKLSYFEE